MHHDSWADKFQRVLRLTTNKRTFTIDEYLVAYRESAPEVKSPAEAIQELRESNVAYETEPGRWAAVYHP